MMEQITDDEDYLELVNLVHFRGNNRLLRPRWRRRRPRGYRRRRNLFHYFNDQEFLDRYRLPKNTVRQLAGRIAEQITSRTNWNHALTAEEMLLVTLRFYASGSFLQVVGDFHGIDKSTASRVIAKVSKSLARLAPYYIAMPSDNNNERNEVMTELYNISSFPRCIGALDCTHIKILSPGGPQAEIFRNRKDFFSLNVQVICDAKLLIRNIVCRWPGSAHDSTIFNNSRVRHLFENGHFGDFVILGDSGYPVKSYLLTPLANPQGRAERLYNESQIRTRNPVERCFGVWKRRFPILALGNRLKLRTVQAVIVACAVLHNIARIFNLPDPPVDCEIERAIMNTQLDALPVADIRRGNPNNLTRHAIIHQYFGRM